MANPNGRGLIILCPARPNMKHNTSAKKRSCVYEGIFLGLLYVCYLKGTQDWEFFWLRFWNLRYFFVSYVKILRFYKKNFLIGPLLGEVRFFRVVLGLRGMKKNFELGQKFFFLSSIMDPKYDPILVFWKFNQLNAPGTTLCVDLGSKCQILFPLVWD